MQLDFKLFARFVHLELKIASFSLPRKMNKQSSWFLTFTCKSAFVPIKSTMFIQLQSKIKCLNPILFRISLNCKFSLFGNVSSNCWLVWPLLVVASVLTFRRRRNFDKIDVPELVFLAFFSSPFASFTWLIFSMSTPNRLKTCWVKLSALA